jgi:hypothetical protein
MKKNVDFEKDADRLGLVAIFEADHYHLQPKQRRRWGWCLNYHCTLFF